jgi:TolB-like protein
LQPAREPTGQVTFLSEIGRWIAENEALLSGMAAMVVLAGVIFSPLGGGLRKLFARRDSAPPAGAPPMASTSPGVPREDPVPADELLLAVLAFDNLSTDPEMQFFSDGVSEEIIQRLSRGARLKVIGRTSSFQFRGQQKGEAARTLRCSHVIDGSVQRTAGRVRISAHLVEARSGTTLWSERYDRGIEDVLAVQDEIAEQIAGALDRAFSSWTVAPAAYDQYLRASPKSYAPNELRTHVGALEVVTREAPGFAAAWGRLAYLRSFLGFYQPYAERPAIATVVEREAARALDLDPQNADALAGRLFVLPAFGCHLEAEPILEELRRVPGAVGSGDGKHFIGWYLRTTGRVREALQETERVYKLDSFNPVSANMLALARLAAGRLDEAVPVFEDLVERMPDLSFPLSSLLRVHAFRKDWDAVDRLLALAAKRQLREFEEGLQFIRVKRDPTPERLEAWLADIRSRHKKTGGLDVARLVYAAHLGLVDEAYQLADSGRLGPTGSADDILGPDAYRPSLLFQVDMPELRSDPRFPRLCARLGLVEFWTTTGIWPDCASEVPYDFAAECAKVRDIPKEEFGP